MTSLWNRKKTDKIGKPQNENQRRASQENFLIFLLSGAIGSLGHFMNYRSCLLETSNCNSAVYQAIAQMKSAIDWIKFDQQQRQLRNRKKK